MNIVCEMTNVLGLPIGGIASGLYTIGTLLTAASCIHARKGRTWKTYLTGAVALLSFGVATVALKYCFSSDTCSPEEGDLWRGHCYRYNQGCPHCHFDAAEGSTLCEFPLSRDNEDNRIRRFEEMNICTRGLHYLEHLTENGKSICHQNGTLETLSN